MTDDTVAYMGWGISAQEQIDGFRREVRELKAENANLRELVHGLEHCTAWANEDGKDCWSCPLWHEKCIAEDVERELGVEVDE